MKRDWNLIRKLVLAVEDAPGSWTTKLSAEGYSRSEMGYHAHLVTEAGLANGSDMTTSESGPQGFVISLTWAGHDFADSIRDDDRWSKAVSTMTLGNQVSFQALKGLLASEIRPPVSDVQSPAPKPEASAVNQSSTEKASQKIGAKRGPKADRATAEEVMKIIESVASAGEWKTKLADVCEALDSKEIQYPSTWPRRGSKIISWSDAALLEPQLAIKAIEYRIKIAKA